MKKLFFLVLFGFSIILQSQEVSVLKFPELQKKILTADTPITIFNFWATWCGPCIREIPHFERYSEDENVKVYLISLDFPDEFDKVQSFVKKRGLKSEVILLNESDYDSYMDKVSKEWTGAIPATLFVDKWGKTYFHESEFSKEDLNNTIKNYLSQKIEK